LHNARGKNFENTINMIKDMDNQEKEKEEKGANNNGGGFKLILLTSPKVVEDTEQDPSKKEDQRPVMTGTIDQIGCDLKKIKDMGVEHVIFGYSFGPIGRDVDKMIQQSSFLNFATISGSIILLSFIFCLLCRIPCFVLSDY
jgi:hypothetical protein